jgi:tetratricopeptide (TPR) repeat protein
MKNIFYFIFILTSLFHLSCGGTQPANTRTNIQSNTQTNVQSTAAKSSYDYAQEGSAFFLKRNYQKAIEPYQKSFDLEKEQPKLDKNLWRAVTDNLAMSYGITGNLPKAKETLEYGLSKDPDYPMFYYIMANVYAEMNDEDNAIVYLERAYERKENMIAGETFPDPMTDDSFQRFVKSEKFVKAVKELKQKNR